MLTNQAARLESPFADLTVGPAPYSRASVGELVVRNRAVAINPLDELKQSTGNLVYRWLPYPHVMGEDIAGEVVEVGVGVTGFAVGDRVIAYAVGMERSRDHITEGGFQAYTVVRSGLASPIPDALPFERAVVLPLAVSTAASALFQQDQLGLRFPTSIPTRSRDVLVVWGGGTSVGMNAIQLARAAGYTVITTASPARFDRLRELGADHVFDRHSETVVQDISAAARGTHVAGVMAIGTGSAEPSVAIAAATGSKRVALSSPSVSFSDLPRTPGLSRAFIATSARLVAGALALQVRSRLKGIRVRFIWGSSLMTNEVGPMLWQNFLPVALAEGRYIPAPEALVVGHGLEHVQTALNMMRNGHSGRRKLVVTLS